MNWDLLLNWRVIKWIKFVIFAFGNSSVRKIIDINWIREKELSDLNCGLYIQAHAELSNSFREEIHNLYWIAASIDYKLSFI